MGRPVAGLGEPALQDGGGTGEDEEGKADDNRQHAEGPEDGAGLSGRLPGSRDTEGKNGEGKQGEDEVEKDLLAAAEPARGGVGVEVTKEEDGLEEDEAGVPDSRGAAEEGEGHLGEHGLDEKEEGCAREHGEREEDQRHLVLLGLDFEAVLGPSYRTAPGKGNR